MASTTPNGTDLSAYAGAWTLDPARTTVNFYTKALWIVPVKGSARAIEGSGRVGIDGSVEGRLVIDATSIVTGMKKRDHHLQAEDFFDVERYPTIEFVLNGVRPLGSGRLALEGTLSIRGHSQPVTLDSEVSADGQTATVAGTIADLDRRDWGVSGKKIGADVHNQVTVTAAFRRTAR